GNNGTPLSFEGRLYYWSMYTEADKADDRGPLKVNTRRTDTYLEGAGAVRGQAVSGAKALEGAQITIYRWMDHRFEEYTEYSVTDINGEYSLSDVPYGLYGLKAEFEGMAGYTAFEHCSQETEVGPVDMEQPIRSIVVSDSPAYFTSGGSDFYYNVHAIGAGEQHLLSADGNLSLFSLLGADIDHVRFRVWLHDDRSVFVEHIDPDQVNAYSSFDTPVTYALYRLDGKNRFVRIKSAVATGGDGKIKSIKLYENGEQVNEITFDYTAVLRLNAFFRKEGITFGGVRNAQGWNTTISYYLSNDTKGKLVFDSAAGDTSYMRDDAINRYYRPMNVRPDDQTRENRVDVLVDDISKAIGKMELKSTEKNSGGGYTERYEIGEYYTVTVSVNRDGMIESVVFNDTNYIFLVLTMMSNRRMEPTDAMIKFYEAAVASEAVSLTEAQRSELLEYDFNASAKITVEEGLFSNASNTKKSSDKTIGNTRVIYYKYRDYYAGDWVTSSLTLRFDQ
ncbi:MAG: carboxypeptidase regulatory-like domain-containing protein, partial [Clostridia bacterium]|nr:carboxypeptidase regulatory-like domain-containing protein [Clostridia bacterium]